jgi:hypothetical protein
MGLPHQNRLRQALYKRLGSLFASFTALPGNRDGHVLDHHPATGSVATLNPTGEGTDRAHVGGDSA